MSESISRESLSPAYGFRTELSIPFQEALERVHEELQREGLTVLSEVDVQDTFKKKLDMAYREYRILAITSLPLAYQALSIDSDVGLLLPLTVVVYEGEKEGTSVVAVLDPVGQLAVAGDKDLDRIGREVRSQLERVAEGLA